MKDSESMSDKFYDHISQKTRLIIACAREYALRSGAPEIMPEHILRGVFDAPESNAHRILQSKGVNVSEFEHIMTKDIMNAQPQSQRHAQIAISKATNQMFGACLEYSSERGSTRIGSETLLLSIIDGPMSVASQLLHKAGVNKNTIELYINVDEDGLPMRGVVVGLLGHQLSAGLGDILQGREQQLSLDLKLEGMKVQLAFIDKELRARVVLALRVDNSISIEIFDAFGKILFSEGNATQGLT